MKQSEVFWEAACDVTEHKTNVPEYAVMVQCQAQDKLFFPMLEKMKAAGLNRGALLRTYISFDFLHFMALKAEDEEQRGEDDGDPADWLRGEGNAPMIPISKLSDVQLGDNEKLL